MSSTIVHEREQDDEDVERYSKRTKTDFSAPEPSTESTESTATTHDHVLPPSHALLGIPLPEQKKDGPLNFMETDVGISEYIGRGDAKIHGIIKQRFTDFLVFEVDQDSRVIHLKDIRKPQSSKKGTTEAIEQDVATGTPTKDSNQSDAIQDMSADNGDAAAENIITSEVISEPSTESSKPARSTSQDPWPTHFDSDLAPFLSEDAIAQVKQMYLEGPEPPRISDSGWGGRTVKLAVEGEPSLPTEPANDSADKVKEDKSRDRGERGRRGGRGGRGGRSGRQDERKVMSKPIDSKDTRTAFHKIIRELFKGKLDTETDSSTSAGDDGARIVIKWARRGGGRGGGRGGRGSDGGMGRGECAPRGTYPPYIHFSLQKTNRDTQDALGHLSRLLRVNVKDLSVAGTKDKRGVTVQRVSLKRNNKIVEDVWKLANNIGGRRTEEEAVKQRGERGVRIADFNYRKASLELGMLKGNAFVITLRNVEVDSMQTLDEAMNTIKNKGFINYYGMQRFGTASVPTHSIGLALLQSNWQKAVSLILQTRHGEHPDVVTAREAWLIDGNIDKALELMPRRVVAERCILESYKKQGGDTRNAMGALSTIPRNLRLMYIHAYQSYVWNAIVSERIRTYGADRPVVGDLVFEIPVEVSQDMDVDVDDNAAERKVDLEEQGINTSSRRKSRKPYVAPRVKTLTEDDIDKYTVFDVIMPLPGTDVAYPGGKLGERYREFLRMDGLDPDNFVRKQRDYTLNGSYRAILHLPKELTWSVLHYTDPDVSLAQSDEDKLLGFDPPAIVEDGKFMALQIQLTLGTAAYATMALREITKTDTSSHFQTSLTANAEDQKYRGQDTNVAEGMDRNAS
ncbi:pseudouridine synthase [Cyathus striatus]|nr:pseudouridine synthase [Cyathus striatus]